MDKATAYKTITTTNGKHVTVDSTNFAWLSEWWWYAKKHKHTYYACRHENGRTIYMHRQILGLEHGDGILTDHADGNGLNNYESNLRACNFAQNSQNQTKKRRYKNRAITSSFKGVSWDKNTGKWRVKIGCCGKQLHLGLFQSEVIAAKVYDKKAKELYGEFAHANF